MLVDDAAFMRRDFPQPCHHGKLGDPVQSELAKTPVQTHEAGTSDPFRDPCG